MGTGEHGCELSAGCAPTEHLSVGRGVGPTYLHKRGHYYMFLDDRRRALRWEAFFAARFLVGLRETGPARAGKLGGGVGLGTGSEVSAGGGLE